jgi:copper chaperone
MTIQIKVPGIACEVCAETITKAIQNKKPDAQVSVDVDAKIVTVETQAPESQIKEAILAAGYTFE